MWELDCRSKDFTAFGTAYGKARSVVMTHPDGARRDARFVGEGNRRAFVLVADGAMLPGDFQALDAKGRVVSSEHFESATELCASDDTDVPNPLSVNHTF